MAPADLIAIVYLARGAILWLVRPTASRVAVVAIAFLCITVHNAAFSTFRTMERKNVVGLNIQLAEFLRSYREPGNADSVELFFPYADGKRLMELSAYLRYKGFQLVGQSVGDASAGPPLVIEGREQFPNNRCIGYRDYTCIHAESPKDGSLIVVLPDDDASMRDVEDLGKDTVLLLSMKPCKFCAGSWFRSLYEIAPTFHSELPEHWLQLDVFERPAE